MFASFTFLLIIEMSEFPRIGLLEISKWNKFSAAYQHKKYIKNYLSEENLSFGDITAIGECRNLCLKPDI